MSSLFALMMPRMAAYLDSVPFSGIIRIRDMMFSVDRPFRLDQGDISFDVPPSVKDALVKGVADNRSHYVQTTGIAAIIERLVAKLGGGNGIGCGSADDVRVTTGGIHGVF